jgi:hypothetical protein
VKWFLDQFLGQRRRQVEVACYLRENGPIAYELSLFADNAREPVEAMFETGLTWYWTKLDVRGGTEPPEWIELTRWSMAALLGDLAPPASEGRTLVIGIEPQESRSDIARDLVGWGGRFVTDDQSPLVVVIHQAGGRSERVFVAQQPPEPVLTLLHAWGIDRTKAVRRAYARLRDDSLESLVARLPR